MLGDQLFQTLPNRTLARDKRHRFIPGPAASTPLFESVKRGRTRSAQAAHAWALASPLTLRVAAAYSKRWQPSPESAKLSRSAGLGALSLPANQIINICRGTDQGGRSQ